MTSPSDSLINLDRMKRFVICLNPDHVTLEVFTWLSQPKCPICGNSMVTVIKSVVKIDELAK